jgi:hypothetical protein
MPTDEAWSMAGDGVAKQYLIGDHSTPLLVQEIRRGSSTPAAHPSKADHRH